MVDLSKIALAKQMLDSAEKSVQSARQLLLEVSGSSTKSLNTIRDKAQSLEADESGDSRVVEGVFDGINMIGPDGKQYPVPANYASKSKLIEGDTLKLTITEDGSFVYKQIGPIERKKILGTLTQGENADWFVLADAKSYRVLLASVTYFKGEVGDEVTLIVPKEEESEWGAIENVIKKGQGKEGEDAEGDVEAEAAEDATEDATEEEAADEDTEETEETPELIKLEDDLAKKE